MKKTHGSWAFRLTVTLPGLFLGLIDHVFSILTLGTWFPDLELHYLIKATTRHVNREMSKREIR